MKKILFALIMVLVCTACTQEKKGNKLSVTNNFKVDYTGIQYLDGTLNDVFIAYFQDDSIVSVVYCSKIKVGETKIFYAPPKAHKAKVFMKWLPKESDLYNSRSNTTNYVKGFVYLNESKDTSLELTDKTKLDGSLYE